MSSQKSEKERNISKLKEILNYGTLHRSLKVGIEFCLAIIVISRLLQFLSYNIFKV